VAARPEFSSLTGMHDLLPPESSRTRALVDAFGDHAGRHGFAPIRTPILEDLGVFARLGADTDVVSKEMYAFTDRDGTDVALRPETTAGVARSFIQHHPLTPWRVWYHAEHFRHEKPQKGRYRQHHQVGCEVFGSADPDLDAEIIVMLWDFDTAVLGLADLCLLVNSIGTPETRATFSSDLARFLAARRDRLHPTDQPKIERNPLRILDTKQPDTLAALEGAPSILDLLTADERAHFDRVQAGLVAAGVPFTVEPRLVRGLDYYTDTVFEITSGAIDAAQSTIGGGGRYDGLVQALGGPPTPGVGFGAGVERMLLACDAEGTFPGPDPSPDAYVVVFPAEGDTARERAGDEARDLCLELRREGIAVERSYDGRSPKSQMKAADRSGARLALLIGDDERAAGTVTLRDLRTDGAQRSVPRAVLAGEISASRSAPRDQSRELRKSTS